MWPALICLALLTPVAAAQGPETGRERVFGTVESRTGEPWAGARVALYSRACADLDDAGPADVVEVVSDERGRFRAGVLPWRTYTAWARGPVAGDGSYRATGVAERVVPNTPVLLRELAEPRRSGAVTWRGLEAWKHRAPFRCRIAAAVEHVPEVIEPVGADGAFEVPPLPGERVRVELFGRDDLPIRTLEAALGSLGETLALAPPRQVALRPTTSGGAAFAGGRFVATWRGRVWPITEIGPLGGTVELPRDARHWDYRLLARGFAPAILGPQKGDDAVWAGKLVPGSTVRGQLSIHRGAPAAGWTLAVRHGSYTLQPGIDWVGTFDEVITTDERGRFELSCTYRPTLHVVLRRADEARWPASWREGVLDTARLGSDLTAKGEIDLGEIVLAEELWAADVRLLEPDGAPAIGGYVTFSPLDSDGATLVSTDRGGRARLLLPRCDLAVVGRSGDSWRVLRVHPAGAAADAVAWSLRLEPPVYVGGRAVDQDGRLVIGRRLNVWPAQRTVRLLGETPDTLQSSSFTLEASLDFADNDLRNVVASELNRRPVITDAGGRFRLSLPRITCDLQIHDHPNAGVLFGEAFAFEGESVESLELTIPR